MLIQPRSYQTEAVQCIWDYFRENDGNPVVAMPTGTGKSVVIGMFLESVYRTFMNQKVLVITHVKELIEQNFEKFIALWPGAPAGIYSAGLNRRDLLQKVVFCGIASVAKRAFEFGHVDLVIVDECHLVSPSDETMYQKFFADLRKVNPMLKVIGFTATPWRLGHGKITEEGAIFTDVCFDITTVMAFNRLIAEGFLSPLIPKKTRTMLDVDGVHMRGGEFIPSELQNAVDRDEVTYAALMEAIEYREERKRWLIFAAGVEHAIHIDQMLQTFGMKGAAVHSKMSGAERDEHIRAYKAGEYDYLVNNNILTTGFDCPEVDMIICLRPTASAVLWVQMLGRGTRPAPWARKENCLVLDFAGNTKRLGPINDPVVPKKKGQKGGDAPVKICPKCDCYVHASVRHCTGVLTNGTLCDHEFVFETKLKQGASTEELIRGEVPVVETFRVEHITITKYEKHDRPPMMKVSYFCGYRMFEEYVCVEHPGFAGRKARMWMRERLTAKGAQFAELPEKTEDAINMGNLFKVPTHLRVWINKKYPEIMSYDFEGTAFGKQEFDPFEESPTVKVDGTTSRRFSNSTEQRVTAEEDDDIPF